MPKHQKLSLITEYIEHYRQLTARDSSVLNRKVPREAFADLLDQIGELLLTESATLAATNGRVRTFLNENPLPRSMEKHLPDDFRVFCLALNSLKQWVAAEQAATDRYLLGGTARQLCRTAVQNCLVTGNSLDEDTELHHPVRDGRPPILLSKRGHSSIENQTAIVHEDPLGNILVALKRERHGSWAQLRRGCLDLLGKATSEDQTPVRRGAQTFARKAAKIAGVGYDEILEWLNRRHC